MTDETAAALAKAARKIAKMEEQAAGTVYETAYRKAKEAILETIVE